VLALTPDSQVWQIWLSGYRDTLACLEAGDRAGAVARYRQIYAEYRECLQALPFD